MDYKKIYDKIILRGQKRGNNKKILDGYYESHHIVPKCIGGTDEIENLVLLTAKEHFICHLLLEKIYPNEKGLVLAAYRLIYGNKKFRKEIKVTSKTINGIKQRAIETLKRYGKERIHTEQERKIISLKAKERWCKFNENGRINEVRKNISQTTKQAMSNPEIIKKTKINTGSKWYTNIITNESMHWYQGMEIPDPSIWRKGRPKMREETKEKIKQVQKNIGYYYNDDLKENRRFNEDEPIPEGWVKGRKREYFGNSKINRKNIKEKMIIDRWNSAKLSELHDRVTHN
jgi:hypothetical protein